MPKKSINLSQAAITKVEALAKEENRNFSNMLETIINNHMLHGKEIVVSGKQLANIVKRTKGNG